MQKSTSEKVKFFYELESLRGIAALIVVLFHIPWLNHFYDIPIIRNGYLMVNLFFILSGFVITHNYYSKVRNIKDLSKFLILRIGRLYPLHLVFLIIFLIYEVAKYVAVSYFEFSNSIQPFSINSSSNFVANLLLVHSFGFTESSFNGPSWSISAEFYTYILFALLLIMSTKRFFLYSFFIVVAALSILNFSSYTFGLLLCVIGFFMGVLTYWSYIRLSQIKNYSVINNLTSIIVALTFCYLSLKTPFENDILSFAIFPFMILFIVLSNNHIVVRTLNASSLRWLGKISYSVYMSHAAILWVFTQVLKEILKTPIQYLNETNLIIQTSDNTGTILLVLVISIVLLVSRFTYTHIEDFFRMKTKLFLQSRKYFTDSTQLNSSLDYQEAK